MKHTIWITAVFFSFVLAAQEPLIHDPKGTRSAKIYKTRHSFMLSGGMFVQKRSISELTYGGSASFAYQIYFPSRFVLGFEYLIDRSVTVDGITSNSGNSYTKNIKAYSVLAHIGFRLVRSKHFDFSVFFIPHYNHQKHYRTTFFEDDNEYVYSEYHETFVFLPLLFHRFEFYYKLNKMNAFGLTLDGNHDFEWKNFLGGQHFFLGRCMLTYRFTIPN